MFPSSPGGVGWAATQIAKMTPDVKVLGVASESKHSAIKENGVDYTFTYDQVNKKKLRL